MFNRRSSEKEFLDEPNIPKKLLYRNLVELEFINKYLGGHSVSINGLKEIVTNKSHVYTIMDIGCGGGDSLKAIAEWSKKENFKIDLHGVDLKEDCISYAKINCSDAQINFRCEDFRDVFCESLQINIVHASLFCHHFTENEIIEFIRLCSKNKAIFIINDLERNAIAYYSIKLLTKFFSKSPLVKNDAPLSVLRGFKKAEWQSILQKSGIENYTIKNRWAFRHLVIIYPNEY
jgi:2-polyprenyl-3-methyl-5-hydroxy-6-metoxy-1,4-benzoquinol methylase